MPKDSQIRPQIHPGTRGGRGKFPSPAGTEDAQNSAEGRMPFDKRIYWLLLGVLIVWNLWLFVPRPKANVTVPYSEFIAQLGGGNVTRVRIAGASISGQVARPVVWPPAPSRGVKSGRYLRFETTYPEAVGDAALMPLLRSHNVVVDAVSPSLPWLGLLLTNGLPLVLMVALLAWMGRQAARRQSGTPCSGLLRQEP